MTDRTAWKVADLRAELKSRHLPQVGNKADLIARLLDADRSSGSSNEASTDVSKPADTIPPACISQLRDDASTLVDQPEAPADPPSGNIQKGKRRLSPPSGEARPSRQDDQPETATVLATRKRRRVSSTVHTTDATTKNTDILSILQDACDDSNNFPRLRARVLLSVLLNAKEFCSKPDKLRPITELFDEDPELVADELGISDRKDRELYIKQIVKKDYNGSKGTGFVWAAYYLMPLEQLKAETQIPHPADFKNTLKTEGKDLVAMWLARSKIAGNSTPASSKSRASLDKLASKSCNDTPVGMVRSRPARDACWRRDKGACVLTGWENPEVAHIFPFAMNKKDAPAFWGLLARLWGDKKTNEWREAVGLTTEKCSNLICLAPVFHTWWGKARFAFKPIPVSANEIRIQFFWLPRANYGPTDEVDLFTSPEDALAEQQCYRGFKPIENGAIFTVTADNPNELPSFEILNMQWHLQRLAAMCGAADVDPEVLSDDDPESPLRGRTLQRQGYDWEWYEPEGSDHGWSEREIMSDDGGSLMDEKFSAGSASITA